MHKGERVKVLGEATGLWKVEGGSGRGLFAVEV